MGILRIVVHISNVNIVRKKILEWRSKYFFLYTFLVWTWLGTINNLFEIKTINVIIKNMFYCSHNLSYWPSYPDVLKIKKVRNEFVDFFYKKYFHFILQQFFFFKFHIKHLDTMANVNDFDYGITNFCIIINIIGAFLQ